MRPLPPYTVRPLKRRDEPRQAALAAGIRELAESLSDEMSVRAGRLPVKPEQARERPRLKVLERY